MAKNTMKNIGKVTISHRIKSLIKALLPKNVIWIYRRFTQKPTVSCLLKDNIHLRKYNIGDYSHGSLLVTDANKGSLTVGKYCSFARGATVILAGEHPTDWVTTYHSFYTINDEFRKMRRDTSSTKGDVVIGHDVWMGNNAVIMSGVTVGNGAIIGAFSIVRKDVPPYAIMMGNPARAVGYRFSKEQIEEMEKIAWWDWPLEKVKEAYPLLLSPNIGEFIEKYKV